ncbi:MAG: hypothetical protein LC775_07505, partial [Acidobacteria bacterium]|nr:hypothetical protein [Acidobacteriota bacterium]
AHRAHRTAAAPPRLEGDPTGHPPAQHHPIPPAEVQRLTTLPPLPSEWVAQEDDVLWRTVTAQPACDLSDHLRQHGRPARLDTSIERLATDCAVSPEWVHDALDGMIYRGWLFVQRRNLSVDRGEIRQLPEHARITLVAAWPRLDDGRNEKSDDEESDNEDIDLSKIQWRASPWVVYRSVSQDSGIAEDTLKVLSNLPFRVKNPDGGKGLACLDELAVAQGMSINMVVDALRNLEQASLVRWNADHQHVDVAVLRGLAADGISEVIQRELGRA